MTHICFFKLLGLKRVNCESKIWVKREATCKVRRWVEELCWRERVDSITVRCRSSAIDAIDVEEEEDDDDSDEDKASFFCCCSEESDTDTGAEAEASSPLDAVSAISSSLLVLLCFVLFCFVWLLDLRLYYMYKPFKCPHWAHIFGIWALDKPKLEPCSPLRRNL